MANNLISSVLDMHDVNTTYGTVTSCNASELTTTIGPLKAPYTGSFTYDSIGDVYGTRAGFNESITGMPIFASTGLNVSAGLTGHLISTNQDQTLFQTALARNDHFTLQARTRPIDGHGGFNTVMEPLAYSCTRFGQMVHETVTSVHSSAFMYVHAN